MAGEPLFGISTVMDAPPSSSKTVKRQRLRRWVLRGIAILAGLLVTYVLLAYVILPALWRHYEHHPAMQDAPKTTQTAQGIPGDPLNVALVGTESEVLHALLVASWYPADPITFRTIIRVGKSVLLGRPYQEAPVSNLYVWGRREDLAFEQTVGKSPRQRHHVRLWRSDELGVEGRPLWVGAATFDRGVGLSHFTKQVTHHIAPDTDAERDKLIADLKQAGQLIEIYQVTGVGATLLGHNGEGDWYYTDGELTAGVLSPGNAVQAVPPAELSNPIAVDFKNQAWSGLRGLLGTPERSRFK